MIHLTESIIGIKVPVDSRNFKIMDGRTDYKVNLWFDSKESKGVVIGEGNDIYYSRLELLGVIGGGEEIPEEPMDEKLKRFLNSYDLYYEDGESANYVLSKIFESKGIDLTKEKIVLIKTK